LSARYWTERNQITGKRTDRAESNKDAIAARVASLPAAVEAAEAMKLIPNQAEVPAVLAKLRDGLPAIKDL
jgi:hypothetical protein